MSSHPLPNTPTPTISQAFIPRRLEEVAHYERDQARVLKAGTGNVEGIYYQVRGVGGEGESSSPSANDCNLSLRPHPPPCSALHLVCVCVCRPSPPHHRPHPLPLSLPPCAQTITGLKDDLSGARTSPKFMQGTEAAEGAAASADAELPAPASKRQDPAALAKREARKAKVCFRGEEAAANASGSGEGVTVQQVEEAGGVAPAEVAAGDKEGEPRVVPGEEEAGSGCEDDDDSSSGSESGSYSEDGSEWTPEDREATKAARKVRLHPSLGCSTSLLVDCVNPVHPFPIYNNGSLCNVHRCVLCPQANKKEVKEANRDRRKVKAAKKQKGKSPSSSKKGKSSSKKGK